MDSIISFDGNSWTEWLQLPVVLLLIAYLYFTQLRQVRQVPLLIHAGLALLIGRAVFDITDGLARFDDLPVLGAKDPLHYVLKNMVFELAGFGCLAWGACVALVRHRRLQSELNKEQQFRHAVLSSLEMGVIVLDQQQQVLYINPKASDVIDAGLSQTPTSEDRVERGTAVPDLAWSQDEATRTYTVGSKTFQMSQRRIPGPEELTVCSWWDVSDWDRSRRLSHEFVSAVSHELRTPLTSIRGYLELLTDDLPLDEEHKRYLEVVQANVDRLVLLAEDLLDLSRIEAGMIQLDLRSCAVGPLVRDAAEAFAAELFAKQLTLQMDIEEESLQAYTDVERLHEVLSNLLSNACKYTPRGGHVTVRVSSTESEVVITVTDTGIGIPFEEQPRIFERFFRSSTSRMRHIKGTGLGLAITKSLVERLHGTIWFTSDPATGSSFSVALPRRDTTLNRNLPVDPAESVYAVERVG